jgi:hypothetical protein
MGGIIGLAIRWWRGMLVPALDAALAAFGDVVGED